MSFDEKLKKHFKKKMLNFMIWLKNLEKKLCFFRARRQNW